MYLNIKHNLIELTDEQILKFQIVSQLTANLNYLKPSHVPINIIEYKDNIFSTLSGGYIYKHLNSDIKYALTDNLDEHIKFIKETVNTEISNFLQIGDKNNSSSFLSSLFFYYGFDSKVIYPLYKNTHFEDFIKDLCLSIQMEYPDIGLFLIG